MTDELGSVSIGFLGMGIMGSPMAQNLLKAGYKSSPEEVTAACDLTFAMLADPESAIDVACGKNGAVSGISSGKGYVDVSTVDAASSILISKQIKDTGALFLEAPVSGSKKPAEDGQLIFLTADSPVSFNLGSMMASFAEGILLSQKVGLDPNVMVEVVSQGAINAPMYSLKGPSMIKSVYPTAFPLKHQQKDMRLALGLAESVSQSTPIAAAANELYKVAKSYGLSDEDFSAVIEALKAARSQQS
ncbi:hypothetical protein Bca4012_061913 [Brassica carinata]